jgi:hypothetical protein
MMDEMPYDELLQWVNFFRRRPIGYREDQRTFLMLQAQGFKGKPEDVFASLKQMKDNTPAEIKALPKGLFLDMMLKSKDGDDSDWTPPWMNNGKK